MLGLQILGIVSATLITMSYGAIISGYTLATLWGWFVVPVFALPALGIMQAYGLMLISSLLRGIPKSEKEEKTFGRKIGEAVLRSTLLCGIILGTGYIVKEFV